MDPLLPALAILGGPLAALAAIGLIPPLRRSGKPAAWVSIAGIGTSFVAAVGLLLGRGAAAAPWTSEIVWAPLERYESIRLGLLVDGLSVPMAAVVTLVALLIQVYSLEYMREEPRASLGRYYAYHSLFAFAMLGLVLSHNLLQTYMFWELVGLGSYLLIGFWIHKPEAARAAVKAFWTTRLGDVGFAAGIVLLWSASGTFVFSNLFGQAADGSLAGTLLVAGVAGLYVGAMGKSAQFPLHVWLPDAMEGPTPVSALIHAATMVAAGVYLMVRVAPLLEHTPQVAAWVLGIGALTALVAASLALVERDVKRVLAYSTVSQLGYMMAAVGAGAVAAAFYHLVTHAFFKALLFLAAGSLIHALHTNDLHEMGRLWRKMPRTGLAFLVGGMSLAGVFPTAGFFSKDAILAELWESGHPVAFAVLLATAAATAFYMFRAFFLAFFGSREARGHAHESPATMLLPMGVLALLAVGAGALASPVARSLAASISLAGHEAEAHHGILVPLLASLAGLGGIALAWLGYQTGAFSPARVHAACGPLSRLVERRFFLDDLFLAAYRGLYLALSALVGWIDRYVVDGLVNVATWITFDAGTRLRALHTGRVQDALYAVAAGLAVLAWLALGT